MFLGERNRRHRTSLVMGAFQQNVRPENRKLLRQPDIEAYLELWDYANDAIYRGFVVDGCGQRTLFVFLDSQATSHGIKTAYVFPIPVGLLIYRLTYVVYQPAFSFRASRSRSL